MKKFFCFLLLVLNIFFGNIAASAVNWSEAKDFSDNQLRIIARQVVNGEQGQWRLEGNNHIMQRHAGNDAADARSREGEPLSYFRLQNHNLETYRSILNYAINNGNISEDPNSPKRFAVSATIPENRLEDFGAKDDQSIGVWMRGQDYKKVRKVKAVFSVINMPEEMINLNGQQLISGMQNQALNFPNKQPGDLITLFPIPNNW